MAESSDSDEEIVAALLLIKDFKSKRKRKAPFYVGSIVVQIKGRKRRISNDN